MRTRDILFGISLAFMVALTGCEKKYDLGSLPQEGNTSKDTSYVPLSPPFGGFTGPEDVMVGIDQLMYVADTRANRIVMLNLAGAQLSTRSMLHPVSLAQDSRLDLLVSGEIVAANGDTIGAIFRVHLVSASPDSAHHLDLARIDTIWSEAAHPQRRFPGITVLPDNSWLAVRAGTDNSSPIDPDGRVLEFTRHDEFITPLPSFITGGQSPISINRPSGIASFPGVKDFVLVQWAREVSYAALWMQYIQNSEVDGWFTKYDAVNPIDFFKVGRYVQPEAVTIDKARRDIFVADAVQDSIFKFNSRGGLKAESFGIVRSHGLMQRPTGLTFFNRTLYVLDGQRGEVLRFILTTDVIR